MFSKTINECYEKSIELLLDNSSKIGILASSPQARAGERNYLSVFSRDASICALGMVASKEKKLVALAKTSLMTLVKNQAENGQIPNYVKEDGAVDFWRMGCIDATLWWLLAVNFYDRNANDKTKLEKRLQKQIQKALFWLSCQEHVKDGLVMQNEASDWADIMPRSGKVLYSNALWAKVKAIYEFKNSEKTKSNFNNLFYPFNNVKVIPKCEKSTVAEIRKQKPTNYLLSFVNYLFWGGDIDVYGNALAIAFGLTDKKLQNKIISHLATRKHAEELPMPVVFNPIEKNSKFWRKYMESHNQNMPFKYHNGGIWPYASSFWAVALAKSGKRKEALAELEKIAAANKRGNWRFSEWMHGKDGRLFGMRGQSWNAGMFIFTCHYLKGEVEL